MNKSRKYNIEETIQSLITVADSLHRIAHNSQCIEIGSEIHRQLSKADSSIRTIANILNGKRET